MTTVFDKFKKLPSSSQIIPAETLFKNEKSGLTPFIEHIMSLDLKQLNMIRSGLARKHDDESKELKKVRALKLKMLLVAVDYHIALQKNKKSELELLAAMFSMLVEQEAATGSQTTAEGLVDAALCYESSTFLYNARLALGLQQECFATAVDWSVKQISRIENAERKIKRHSMLAVECLLLKQNLSLT
ncbi:hypothetical protein VCHA53O466_50241 [Vibrio chagasii]|nr:hypothetical protein VCHA53O466_50241 [Vibrio chagasii]